jgi:hypothetical protein
MASVGQRPGGHEPLQRQPRLDLGPAAVAVADRVGGLLDPLQQAQLGQGRLDLAAGGVAVQALEAAALALTTASSVKMSTAGRPWRSAIS